eukprot:jgi/Chlat1/813/Chrsp104S01275
MLRLATGTAARRCLITQRSVAGINVHGLSPWLATSSVYAGRQPALARHAFASSAASLSSSQAEGGANNNNTTTNNSSKRTWAVRLASAVVAVYVASFAGPMIGIGMASQAVALAKSRDPMMQKSGASRIRLLSRSERSVKEVVQQGGAEVLMALLQSSDKEVVKCAAAAIAAVAETDAGAEALLAASLLSVPRAALTDEPVVSDISAARTRLLQHQQFISQQSPHPVKASS